MILDPMTTAHRAVHDPDSPGPDRPVPEPGAGSTVGTLDIRTDPFPGAGPDAAPREPGPLRCRLEPLDGQAEIRLDRPMVLVGRHPRCDVRLDSTRISRLHCCLAVVPGGLAVRDLGSTNGTRINRLAIEQGLARPGDVLAFAELRYRLVVVPNDGG